MIFFSSDVLGPIVIKPTISKFCNEKQEINSLDIIGKKPFFWVSPLVFISIKHSVFWDIFWEALFILLAILKVSTLSIVSKKWRHLFILFDWRWPINLFFNVLKPGKSTNLFSASWTLFSPILVTPRW